MTRVLALDYGSARCGCAISDPSGTLATPIEAIEDPASEGGLEAIARLVAERDAEEVVVGLPVGLSGSEGPQAKETRAFVVRLAEAVDVPVHTHDERFTTQLAQRTPGRTSEDSRAAAHLLKSYLDAAGRS
ncbi:MAG: Holliday junction resolvase RuvX [Solirubrobacterales bacterium]